MKKSLSLIFVLLFSAAAFAELNTTTYVTHDGEGSGAVEGDMSGVGEVTLLDIPGGDMWNGGDQFIYLHDSAQTTGGFLATVRVVSQTEAIDGRWGKAGIRASANLTGDSANAMAQVAAGNGSQVDAPAAGDHSPVPVRIGGRTGNDGEGGFELPVLAAPGTDAPVTGSEIANDVFPTAGARPSWLSLNYNATDNSFVTGYAIDVGGAPGVWNFSDPVTNVPADGDGWYVGLGYSAHGDLAADQITRGDGFHGVTFDNFTMIPEPSSIALSMLGMLGLLGFRKRNR